MMGLRLRVVTDEGELGALAAGVVVKPFDSWLDSVVDVQMAEDSQSPLDETA